MASRLGWLFKSRSGNALLGLSGLLGYGLYDRSQAAEIKESLRSRVAHLAQEPLSPTEFPRKLTVFLPATQWADYWFKEFAKPVLDAAALDYDLVKIKEPEDLRDKMRTLLWDAKETWIESSLALNKESLKKPPRRTWFQWLRGLPPPEYEPPTPSLGPNYNPEEGLVALSPALWKALVDGLQDGALGSRPSPSVAIAPADPVPPANDLDSDGKDLEKEPEKASQEPPITISLSPNNLPTGFPLPTLGFLPGDKELPFTTRISGFFHRRLTHQNVGEAAVKVALGNCKPLAEVTIASVSDAEEGEKNLDPDLALRTSVYY